MTNYWRNRDSLDFAFLLLVLFGFYVVTLAGDVHADFDTTEIPMLEFSESGQPLLGNMPLDGEVPQDSPDDSVEGGGIDESEAMAAETGTQLIAGSAWPPDNGVEGGESDDDWESVPPIIEGSSEPPDGGIEGGDSLPTIGESSTIGGSGTIGESGLTLGASGARSSAPIDYTKFIPFGLAIFICYQISKIIWRFINEHMH